MANPAKPLKESVHKEFPPLGKYRVRILEDATKTRGKVLDIREYVSSEGVFEGYTRRGIRLTPAQVDLLGDILSQVRESMGI